MRPLTFEEREDLVRRSEGLDLLDFIDRLRWLRQKHKISHRRLLAILLRSPKRTDISSKEILRVRNHLAEEGAEFTPAEVIKTIESVLCKVRNRLRDRGVPVPDSDVLFLEILRVQETSIS